MTRSVRGMWWQTEFKFGTAPRSLTTPQDKSPGVSPSIDGVFCQMFVSQDSSERGPEVT